MAKSGTTKAAQAAQRQSATRAKKSAFDPGKLELLHEADPIDVGRHGVLSVQVYSYDGADPKIGVYRVGISTKTGEEWQTKQGCPLTCDQAAALAKALREASNILKKKK